MTLTKVLQLALRRVGLDESSSVYLSNARDYFNTGTKDLGTRRAFRWLFKRTTFTTVQDQRSYDLASDVMRPLSFVNVSYDAPMQMVDPEEVDTLDPDRDETGDPRAVYVTGIDTSSGVWEVDLYPLPDDSATTISYRYYAFIADKTSSDDATDLAATMPPWAQNAMIHYIASRYKGELGDLEGEAQELSLFEGSIEQNIAVDGDVTDGNRIYRFGRADLNAGRFGFEVDTLG